MLVGMGNSKLDGKEKCMSRLLKIGIVGLLVVGVLTVLVVGSALAQEATSTPTTKAASLHGGGFGRGMCGQAGLEAAAGALGMTADELSTQLWGGRTIADVAEKAGVDLQTVRDAVETACQNAVRDAIQQAVQDGRISQEQADWLLQGLENGYWGGGGFGHGFGRGFGGFGGFRGIGGLRGTNRLGVSGVGL